jgi:mono/diheme cytochrome c family protein
MQVKIVIGTVSFLLTMVVLGIAALREPARLAAYAAAAHGRSIESGAHIFQQNCATCHGVEGKAEQCFDPKNGESIDCVGLPLNNPLLICGANPAKLTTIEYAGTKQAYIEGTIAAGRPGTKMPTWSERFGGPLRDDQIEAVTAFILNWEGDWADGAGTCFDLPPHGSWPESVEEYLNMRITDPFEYATQPGDAIKGEELYTFHTCHICHGSLDGATPPTLGPSLTNIAEVGATRVVGDSAAQYVYESILNPNAFIAPDCPTGPCAGPVSSMRQTFTFDMGSNPQDMADLLAYLLGDSLMDGGE